MSELARFSPFKRKSNQTELNKTTEFVIFNNKIQISADVDPFLERVITFSPPALNTLQTNNYASIEYCHM